MKVAIIDYGAGNTKSVQYALQSFDVNTIITANAEEIRTADRIIFPGVGQAKTALQSLNANGLDELIPTLKQPFLGICLGMQLLCNANAEANTKGLGIFNTAVKKITEQVKVPHMGWNTIESLSSPLFNGIEDGVYVYFVHSYFVPISPETTAYCNYGESFSAALNKNNFYGCQFHPEKSGDLGSKILKNFIEL